MKKTKREESIKEGDLIMIRFLGMFEEYEKPELHTTTAKKTVNLKDCISTVGSNINTVINTVNTSTITSNTVSVPIGKFVTGNITTTPCTFVSVPTNSSNFKFFTSHIQKPTLPSAINTQIVNFGSIKNIIGFHSLQNVGEIDNLEFLYETNFDEEIIGYTETMEPFIRALVVETRELSMLGDLYFSKKYVDPHNQEFAIPKSGKYLHVLMPNNKILWIKSNKEITSEIKKNSFANKGKVGF